MTESVLGEKEKIDSWKKNHRK